ncbi:hypothetical protein [Tumidithrix helvetica]|uniref:hypothetical protein n=1 Tax=Tumidithrix helvetica TaxID=3457545 RepID=UPI003CC51625
MSRWRSRFLDEFFNGIHADSVRHVNQDFNISLTLTTCSAANQLPIISSETPPTKATPDILCQR